MKNLNILLITLFMFVVPAFIVGATTHFEEPTTEDKLLVYSYCVAYTYMYEDSPYQAGYEKYEMCFDLADVVYMDATDYEKWLIDNKLMEIVESFFDSIDGADEQYMIYIFDDLNYWATWYGFPGFMEWHTNEY